MNYIRAQIEHDSSMSTVYSSSLHNLQHQFLYFNLYCCGKNQIIKVFIYYASSLGFLMQIYPLSRLLSTLKNYI